MAIKPYAPEKITTGVDKRVVTRAPEIHLNLDAGQLLFAQGDAGGDLYLIETGLIEIFITKNGQSISLAEMGPGEIIGVMTLLTAEARLAAARAKEPSRVKKIPRASIEKLLAVFPKWLHIVLKEFTARINEMNRRYSETLLELRQARDSQITSLFLGTQMAQALAIVGKAISKNQDGVDIVFVDDILEKMELVLNQPREVVAGLWQVMVDSGLIKVEIEQEQKRKIVPLDRLEKVGVFTQFVRESGQGSTRKILRAKFKYKELATLSGLIKFVIKEGAQPEKSATFKVSDIEANFEKATTLAWDLAHTEKPAKLGLLVRKDDGGTATLTFTPAALARTLGCVAAMKKFKGDDDEDDADAA